MSDILRHGPLYCHTCGARLGEQIIDCGFDSYTGKKIQFHVSADCPNRWPWWKRVLSLEEEYHYPDLEGD